MKTFAKLLAVLLAAVLVLSLAGCGGGTGTGSQTGTTTDSTTTTAAKINYNLVTEGKLIMGTNAEFPPFEYMEGGKVVGFDAAMMEKVAEKLGLALEIKNMDFDSLPEALSSGQIDVIAAGYTVTSEREEQMLFADSYYTARQTIIVKADSNIATKDDLQGKKIGVQSGTTGQFEAEKLTDEVVPFNNGAMAVEALKSGQVDAVIIDNNPAAEYYNENSDTLKLLEKQFEDEDYAVAVKKGNTALLDAINEAIQELKEDGTLDNIKDQYIK